MDPQGEQDAERHNENTETNRLLKIGMRLGISAALHPVEYSKVLIQVSSCCEIF